MLWTMKTHGVSKVSAYLARSVHRAAGHLRRGRSAMSRQQARRLARGTELEHRGQRRFEDHFLLSVSTRLPELS